jgi:hypothetical protein
VTNTVLIFFGVISCGGGGPIRIELARATFTILLGKSVGSKERLKVQRRGSAALGFSSCATAKLRERL